jgi:hypothetical protein
MRKVIAGAVLLPLIALGSAAASERLNRTWEPLPSPSRPATSEDLRRLEQRIEERLGERRDQERRRERWRDVCDSYAKEFDRWLCRRHLN